jgi:uncharacterized protein YaaW (UPF0174 family)
MEKSSNEFNQINSQIQLNKFNEDISNEKQFIDKITSLYSLEFDNIFQDLLLIPKDQIIENINSNIKTILLNQYTNTCFQNKTLTNIINNLSDSIETKYNLHCTILITAWNNFNKEKTTNINYLQIF